MTSPLYAKYNWMSAGCRLRRGQKVLYSIQCVITSSLTFVPIYAYVFNRSQLDVHHHFLGIETETHCPPVGTVPPRLPHGTRGVLATNLHRHGAEKVVQTTTGPT
ncbi:hypothetical protein OS493_020110 [Desmophyllum pertusum]|uniref:Uncharacterized protein n=1 Tax=Desmophyllum pertusum TaxID=174260 RepID=A0A9X0A078_9CNID|nr:hypothetical protein OS493_020110 [Desmophyllum pertusum]